MKCFECGDDTKGKDYTTDQCEKEQTVVECPGAEYPAEIFTCFKFHGTTKDDKEKEFRGCTTKLSCERNKKFCEEPTEEQKEEGNVKECEAACCVSDGDIPCNRSFTVSINMISIMCAVLCSLKLF